MVACLGSAAAQSPEQPPADRSFRTIVEAAEHGALDAVQAFLDQGQGVDAVKNAKGETALLAALRANHVDVTNFLLDQGADPRVTEVLKNNALHLAARWGDLATSERLVELGVDVNARNNRNRTPLHIATERRRVSVIRLLIEHGADVNALDGDRRAPIDYALANNDPRPAQVLVEHGATMMAPGKRALARVNLAADKGWQFAVERALQDTDNEPDLHERVLEEAFERAFTNVDLALVDFMATQGARLDEPAPGGLSRIDLAAEMGSPDLVSRLLEKGLTSNGTEKSSGWTPLHFAATSGSLDTMRLLIDAGADVNAHDALGRTPLDLAAAYQNLAGVRVLLHHGASLDTADAMGNTPLHFAAGAGFSPVVKELIAKGESVTIRNQAGQRPYDLAKSSGQAAVLGLLAPPQSGSLELPLYFRQVLRRIPVGKGPGATSRLDQRMRARLWQGWPLLQLALQEDAPDAVRFVLDKDPDSIRERGPYGLQALHLAAEFSDTALLEIVLRHDPSLNDSQNQSRWTPLHFAAADGNLAAVRMLLGHGAKAGETDVAGHTPADLADLAGARDVAKALRAAQ